jgi:hypothetical protein
MSSARENGRRRERGGAAPEGDRQWRVLFIGDHGQVIAFKRIKTLIGLAIGVIATALVAVAVLVVVNARQHARMHEVQEHLSAAQLQIQALRQERDLLTAHVVLAETKVKEVLAGVSRSASVQKPEPAGIAGKATEPRGPQPPEAATEGPPASAEPVGRGRLPAGIEEPVAVEDFYAGLDAARRTLHLRYKLVATRSARKPLTGHVVVVFKSHVAEPERWLAMPPVDLPKGRPSGRQKGYTFSISHSKAFSHSLPAPAAMPAFTQAVLYVFSQDGQLLMARDFDVDIKPGGD